MFAVLHLPQFALQAALRLAPEMWARPVALVDPALSTPRICDRTAPAREQGVELGQTPTQALARCRDLVIRHRSPAQETDATDALLQCAYGFSPHLEHTASGVITLDLRGLSELQNDRPTDSPPPADARQRWARRLQAALSSLQLKARIGIGPTPNLARHAAQWGQSQSPSQSQPTSTSTSPAATREQPAPCIVTDAGAFVTGLPVAALDPSTDVTGILEKWGVRTVGQLLALGQDAVMDRLGLEAIALFAAASTQSVRPLNLVRPSERYAESFDFEVEVETIEPLQFILNRFVDQICQRLEPSLLAVSQLTLRLRLASGQSLEYALHLPQPTRRADVLFRMLQTHLEGVRTDSPIAGVSLQADPTRPGQKQFSLFETALRDPHQFQETLARLSALVGADRVGTPVRENSHRPDRFKLIPPDFENAPATLRRRVAEILRATPLRRLRPPVPASVEPPPAESPPFSLHLPHGSSTELRSRTTLTLALGPWRASGHWWEPGAWTREEWDVQTLEGAVLRLVCSGSPEQWHVEAVLD